MYCIKRLSCACFSYTVRIDGLLVKEEFAANMEYIRPSVDAVIEAAKGTPHARTTDDTPSMQMNH